MSEHLLINTDRNRLLGLVKQLQEHGDERDKAIAALIFWVDALDKLVAQLIDELNAKEGR